MEIEKMSGDDLIVFYEAEIFSEGFNSKNTLKDFINKDNIKLLRQELRKRLSKNNKTINFYSTEEIENLKTEAVEEFKKELIKIIIDTHGEFGTGNVLDMEINNILQLINNTK